MAQRESLFLHTPSYREPRLISRLQIVKAGIQDYSKVHRLHYLPNPPSFYTNVYKVTGAGDYENIFPNPIAVTIYAMPLMDLKARDEPTHRFFKQGPARSPRLKLVNKYIRYAARIIVDDRFRHLGIATWLARDTLPLQGVPVVETLTPIDWTTDMLERIGFRSYPNPAPAYYRRFTDTLNKCGIHPELYRHPQLVNLRIEKLSSSIKSTVLYEMQRFVNHFKSHCASPHSLERTEYILGKLPYPQLYSIWFHPDLPVPW